MTKEILENAKLAFQKAINHLKNEFMGLQAGQANAAMVENISVDCYGQKMTIKALGAITIPEPQQILISPWDKGTLGFIEKAVRESSLGLNPLNDGAVLRITLPKLTEERRKELVKIVHLKLEEAKISIRQSRQDAKSKLEKLEKDKQISEDELRDSENDLQDDVSKANKEAEETSNKKEADVMKV